MPVPTPTPVLPVRHRRRAGLALLVGGAVALTGAIPAAADTPAAATGLAAPVYLATYSGQQPALPDEVTVTTADSSTRSADVVWDTTGYTFAQPYRSYTIGGVADGTLAVQAQVEVVPQDTVYFVDSGSAGKTSPAYEGVKALVGAGLANQVADQAASTGTWGYLSSGLGGTRTSTTPNDKSSNGLYGINGSTLDLKYSLPDLPAGTYTVTVGVQEWWTGPRNMSLVVQPAGGSDTTLVSGVTVGAASQYAKSRTVSATFTQTQDGTATLKMRRGSLNAEAPVIAWFGIVRGAVSIDTSTPTVAAPTADVPAGIYATAQTVTLSSDATVYYTTDGSDASRTNGTRYTGPVTVSSSQTLKAVAFRDGTTSAQLSVAYQIEPIPADGYTQVPVGRTWYDTSGTPIQAHGGNIISVDGWYWWAGENKADNSALFNGISLYKSQDLLNWT